MSIKYNEAKLIIYGVLIMFIIKGREIHTKIIYRLLETFLFNTTLIEKN